MQVNFKGLYKISESLENAKGNGETMHDISTRKFQSFLEDTQKYMDPNGYSYINDKNHDFYLTIRPEYERNFEETVNDYNIDCYKVADNLTHNSHLYNRLKFAILQKQICTLTKYDSNINKHKEKQINLLG